jgi:hypothetical protein
MGQLGIDNPEIKGTSDTTHRTNTNKAKITTQKAEKIRLKNKTLKSNVRLNVIISLSLSTSPSTVATLQHHLRMEYTFHNSCVILGRVHSTLNFVTKRSSWYKSYSSKVTLPDTNIVRSSSWSGWPLLNIHISHGYVSFYLEFFSSFLYHRQ